MPQRRNRIPAAAAVWAIAALAVAVDPVARTGLPLFFAFH